MKCRFLYLVVIAIMVCTGCVLESKKGKHKRTAVRGKLAPDFTLLDQNETPHTLSSYRGHKVALYFYPQDDTPYCTKQACSIRDGQEKLKQAGIIVLGISTDPLPSHWKFAQKYNIHFPLLSDHNHEVTAEYNARGWFGMAKRVTYLIDENGIIVGILDNINVNDHADQIIQAFKLVRS